MQQPLGAIQIIANDALPNAGFGRVHSALRGKLLHCNKLLISKDQGCMPGRKFFACVQNSGPLNNNSVGFVRF
jgi:hypothetical protein